MPMYNSSLSNQLGMTANTEALLEFAPDLFAGFMVPLGMDRQLAINVIRRKHGFAPLYRPDPRWMMNAIRDWTRENMPIWEKLYKTTVLEYNPIWNTDVTERTTDVRTIDRDTTNDSTAIDRAKSKGTLGSLTTGDRHEVTEGTGHEETHGTSEDNGHTETHGTSEGTSHEETHGISDGKTHEETTGKSVTDTTSSATTVTDTTIDGTDSETTDSTKKLDQTVTRDISPENAPDYQPDDQTHTVAEETLKTTTEGKHHETTGVVGNTTSTGNSTTNTSGTSDGTTHGETWGTADGKTTGETWGTEDTHQTGETYGTTDSRTTGKADEVTKGTRQDETHEKSIRHADQKERGTEDVTETYDHGWIRQGNIGVTTTQQMIEAERVTVVYSVYEQIANSYHATFCLDVY